MKVESWLFSLGFIRGDRLEYSTGWTTLVVHVEGVRSSEVSPVRFSERKKVTLRKGEETDGNSQTVCVPSLRLRERSRSRLIYQKRIRENRPGIMKMSGGSLPGVGGLTKNTGYSIAVSWRGMNRGNRHLPPCPRQETLPWPLSYTTDYTQVQSRRGLVPMISEYRSEQGIFRSRRGLIRTPLCWPEGTPLRENNYTVTVFVIGNSKTGKDLNRTARCVGDTVLGPSDRRQGFVEG